jgi:hypothetical protein
MIASYPSKEPLGGHVTFVDVTSGEKATLGQILRNFWLGMRTPFLQSLPVAMVLVLLYYIVYYYYSKRSCTISDQTSLVELPLELEVT